MKYTRFGERDRARLEEEYARLEEEYPRSGEEHAQLRLELARLEEEYARLEEKHGRPMRFCRSFEKRERVRLDNEYARLVKERVPLMLEFAQLKKERARLKEEREWLEHARSTRFLLTIAVRVLPPSERARYLEEFRAELLDVPRKTQLRHTLSLLRGVFVLRLCREAKDKVADAEGRRAKD